MSKLITKDNIEDARMVWSTLYNSQVDKLIPATTSYTWCDSIYNLNIGSKLQNLPNILDINPPTMTLIPAYGKVSNEEFFKRLSRSEFVVNHKMRTMEEVSYLEERDFFHDMFGHVPHLFNEQYCETLRLLGSLHVAMSDNLVGRKMIENLYWRIFEFGAILEDGEVRALGAGIISSTDELNHFKLTKNKHLVDFTTSELVTGDNNLDDFQSVYFVFESFNHIQNEIFSVCNLAMLYSGVKFTSWEDLMKKMNS